MTPEDRQVLQETHDTTIKTHALFEQHVSDPTKHPSQPCNGLKILNNRLFAIAVLAVGGLIAQLWKYATGGN